MLSQLDYLRYFHGGVAPLSTEDYTVELCVEKLLANNTGYRVDVAKLNNITLGSAASLEASEIAIRTHLGNGFNPSSTKDVAAKIEGLHLGVVIPKTAKGNTSITREWLEANQSLHPIFHLVSNWRKWTKTMSTIESVKSQLVMVDGFPTLPTKWRTYAPNGSGRMVAEAYPITQLPMVLHPMLTCKPDRVWANISIPYFDLKLLAFLTQDPKLAWDLKERNPFVTIAAYLDIDTPGDSQSNLETFFHTLLYENYDEHSLAAILGKRDLEFLAKTYPKFYNYLDNVVLGALAKKWVPLGFAERGRDLSLDPEAKDTSSIRRKAMSSLCQQNIAYLIKRLMWRLLVAAPVLESEYWIPNSRGVSFTVPCLKTQLLKTTLGEIFMDEFGSWPSPIYADVSISDSVVE